MTSKTKLLKKGKYTGNATPAPAKKAENKKNVTPKTSNKQSNSKALKKEADARARARRMRSLIKRGMKKELIEEMFSDENNRMVLVLLNGSYSVQDGTRKKKITKRNEKHKVVSTETVEIPNILHGLAAAKKFAEIEKLHFMSGTPNAMWILSDTTHVDEVVEKLKQLGRVSVTKPEKHVSKPAKAKTSKKPSNNTTEAKKAAKTARKAAKMTAAEMRSYYAAKRKGGVSDRIKKYNKTLADKIEAWLKEDKKREAANAEKNKEYRAKHRQLTSIEMKANKRARKAAKHLATIERRKELEKKRMESNAIEREKRAQKAQKPVQAELKMAA